MSARKLALATLGLLLTASLPAMTTSEAAGLHLVFGPAEGLAVQDHYGAFATAWLTRAKADALRAQGIAVEPLDRAVYRGAYALPGSDASVPADLRAAPSDPFFVVQFRGPVKDAWRAALEERSLRVYDSLPHYAFLVKLAPGQAQELRGMPEVAFVAPYHPALKLSPELPAQGQALVTVLTFPGEPIEPAVLGVLGLGGQVEAYTTSFPLDGIVRATLPASQLASLARVPAVSWIEPAGHIGLDNAQASAITQSGQLGNYKVHGKGVDGSSQVASVCDTGVNTQVPLVPGANKMVHELYDDPAFPAVVWMVVLPDDVNLHRKMAGYYAPLNANPDSMPPTVGVPPVGGDMDDTNGHGTHTAGTIAGDAPPYGTRNGNDGVAYAAKLLVCDITNQQGAFYIALDYSQYWDPAYDAGARVNSNSWGQTHTTSYSAVARQHDAYVREHRDFVITRSMGNTGGNTIRPEAVAKSAMGIGAGQNGGNMENLASFSSRGPALDGRIKPNVIAPGDCLQSGGLGVNDYPCLSGTSMSTPTVAGAATLVRDYFTKGFHPSGTANAADAANPSSALVRGILEASGKRITGSLAGTGFPNGNQGWGRVTLDDALYFAGDARKLLASDETVSLSTGQIHATSIAHAGGALRVQLTWTDAPGVAGANPAIVNDLDLEVSGPLGTYKGNQLANGESVLNPAGRDAINVDEGVILANAPAGTYTITVRATNAPSGPQDFALVALHA